MLFSTDSQSHNVNFRFSGRPLPVVLTDGAHKNMFFMHIPLKPFLSGVLSASMFSWTALDETSSAAPGFEEGPATSSTNDDARSLFKLASEISSSTS